MNDVASIYSHERALINHHYKIDSMNDKQKYTAPRRRNI